MFNLAPFKYAGILGTTSGPISRIEYGRVQILGEWYYQANAYLDGNGLGLKKAHLSIYSNADGSGTHRSPMLARYIAISEAIERWAMHMVSGSRNASIYGFDLDKSSNGMSAFPGLFQRQARGKALAEAAERYCMVSWWHGTLPAKQVDPAGLPAHAIEITNPASKDRVVVLWKLMDNGYYAYGFASDRKFKQACWKAYLELDRSVQVLDYFYGENPGFEMDDLSVIDNFQEQRVAYFSLPEGHRLFLNKVRSESEVKAPNKVHPIIDRAVDGPWSKYATVWRVVFPMPTRDYLDPAVPFFFW